MKKGVQGKQSSLQEVQRLFDAAAVVFPESSVKANRLVEKAHKLMLKSRLRLPSVLKRRFCKECRSLWIPGKSVRVRLGKGKVVYSCLGCRHVWRFPLDK